MAGTPETLFDPALVIVCQAGLALILAVGGVTKLMDRDGFEAALAGYDLLPDALLRPTAWGVPLCECAIGFALLVEPWRIAGAGFAALFVVAVSVPLVINLVRGRTDIDCGCGGSGKSRISWLLPLRNLALIALAAVAGGAVEARPLEGFEYPSIALGALAVLALYATVSELLTTQPLIASLRRPS